MLWFCKLFLVDHHQSDCQPYECNTGHIKNNDILAQIRSSM